MRKSVVVVGGGPSGVYLTNILMRRKVRVLCLESRSQHNLHCGRVKTEEWGERGAWRVPKENVLTLGLDPSKKFVKKSYLSHPQTKLKKENRVLSWLKQGFSVFQKNAASYSLHEAIQDDWDSEFPGISASLEDTNPYDSSDQLYLRSSKNKGLGGLFEPMKRKLLEKKLLQYGAYVTDLKLVKTHNQQHWEINCLIEGKGQKIIADTVVLAMPPWAFDFPSIDKFLKPLKMSVKPLSLCHMYLKVKKIKTKIEKLGSLKKRTDVFGTIYPHKEYGKRFNVHSYTSGPVAEFWGTLRLRNSKNEMLKFLTKKLRLRPKFEKCEVTDYEICYNEKAVGMWAPSGQDAGGDLLASLAIEPNPSECPNLFCCGSATSSKQGWIEGALETSLRVATLLTASSRAEDVHRNNHKFVKPTEILIHSRVVDVKAFQPQHPGGEHAFDPFLGGKKDAGELFEKIHKDFSDPWKVAFACTKGFKF